MRMYLLRTTRVVVREQLITAEDQQQLLDLAREQATQTPLNEFQTVSSHFTLHTEDTFLNEQQIQEIIAELVSTYGYRNITELIKAHRLAHAEPGEISTFQYLCVLQTPKGGPRYCKHARALLAEQHIAREAGQHYETCPAPDPRENIWMVAGNFEIDEELAPRQFAERVFVGQPFYRQSLLDGAQ